MSENKNVPKLRFPDFSESWVEKTLRDLLEFKNGYNASKESYGSGEKFINVLDIIQNVTITHDKILGSVELSLSEFEKYKVEYGDILFQRSSETREEVGQANVYLDKSRPATFGGFVIRGKKVGDFEPPFLNYLLRTPQSRNEITSKSGGSTRYNVGQETLSQVPVILPSLPEQQKISEFLTAVDRRIELLQAKKEKLEAYKKGVMQQIFSQKLRFKADDGSDFPDWEERKLGEISSNIGYGLNSSATDYDGKHKYIRITDIDEKTNKFVPSPLTSPDQIPNPSYQVSEGDILFARTGASVGKSYIYRKGDGELYFAGFLIRFSIRNANPYFVFLQTKRSEYQKWVKIMSMRSGQPGINAEEYKSFEFKLPSLAEQQKIVEFLTSLDRSIENLNQQITHTQTWKKGLLQKMFV
ncbi:restriction endonuclease subunit S [Algoriphagus sp.]|uniref:restriction endonuclease subunit S n=1 Tax=Algoriphagus sp. TaxID=1872435 RepID=UPI0039197284